MQADFLRELLSRLKDMGIHTAIDTSGYATREALDKVIPYTDIFLYDIKAVDDGMHKRCTGVSNKQIIENLLYLDSKGCKTEIRIPYVPCYNDGEVEGIARLLTPLKNVTRVRVLPYHSYAGSKYEALGMTQTLPDRMPTDEEIKNAEATIRDILRK